jgi:multiple sugar transport system substrate-binding protein
MYKLRKLVPLILLVSLLAACGGAPATTSAPPTAVPATAIPATAVPATAVPATAVPATAVPAMATAPAATETSAPASNVMELNFWGGWTGPDADVMKQIVDAYNASQSKVHVTLTLQQWTPLFDKFVLSVKSKTVPDILAMHGPDIPQFAEQGVLEPLDSVVSQAGFKASDFATPAWDGTIYKNTQYAFPLDLHMHAVYYNADMLAAANITPPTDWINKDQFLKMATALTVDQNGNHPGDSGFDASNVKQYGLAMYTNHHAFFTFYALLHQQGDNLLNTDQTQVQYPDADGLAAWQWLQDLVYKYQVTPQGETSPLQDFLSGKTALLADGPWEIPAMQKQEGLKWGTFPMPQVFANKAVWGSGHVLTIPVQDDKAREAAAEQVVAWIVQHSATWGDSGNIPALNSARQAPAFTSLKGRDGFIKSLPYEVMLPALPAEAQVFSSAASSPIVVAAQQIVVENKPIEPAMQQMNQAINAILSSP